MHPRNRRHWKLEIARDHFAVFLECVDDHVHAARRVRRKPNLVRLSVDECGDTFSHVFTARKPLVPVHVALVSHLFVVSRTSFGSQRGEWSSRRRVEIHATCRDGKLRPHFSPVGHQIDSLYVSRFCWIFCSNCDFNVLEFSFSAGTGCHLPGIRTCESMNASSAS